MGGSFGAVLAGKVSGILFQLTSTADIDQICSYSAQQVAPRRTSCDTVDWVVISKTHSAEWSLAVAVFCGGAGIWSSASRNGHGIFSVYLAPFFRILFLNLLCAECCGANDIFGSNCDKVVADSGGICGGRGLESGCWIR